LPPKVEVAPESSIVTVKYANWYIYFILNNATNGCCCYSSSLDAFVNSSPSPAFKIDDYMNVKELEALCCFIGPSGVKVLEEKIFQNTMDTLNSVRVKGSGFINSGFPR
jgi:hypothetical protein